MENIMMFIVLGSALYVYYDASRHKIGKIPGDKGFFNLSAGMWATATLLLWIIAFPAYLIKRKSLIEKAKANPQESSNRNVKLGIMAGIIGLVFMLNVMSGSPLPVNDERELILAFERINNEINKMGAKAAAKNNVKKLSPKEARDMIEEAFSNAGYSYGGTIHKLAKEGINTMSPAHVGAAAYVLMPLRSDPTPRPEDVYSGQELKDVKAIMRMMGM